jgi:hypothetical protein
MLSNILDRISFYSLFIVVVLLPIFFLPFTKIPIEISKGLLLIVGLSISIIFWTAARFSDGKIVLPKSRLLLSGLALVVVFLLSALFSPAMKMSFFGTMLDLGTFYFMLACFLLMLFSSLIFNDLKKAKMVLRGSIIAAAVVLLFQSLRLFMPNTLSFGILGSNTGNILGSWNALGLFAGFSVVLSLFILEFLSVSKTKKILLGLLLLLSIIFVAIVNFPTVWWILGIFALIVFVYKISSNANVVSAESAEKKRIFPVFSFFVIMLSLLFLMSGQFIGGLLPNHLGISNFEVRPSFSATMSVARGTLAKNPILGAGPNRFAEMWALHKPVAINASSFWDSSFDQGSGLLPTFAVTTGVLGVLAWLIFLALLLVTGLKSFFSSQKKNSSEISTETVIFFIMSLYLLVAACFYSVGPAMFLLAFIFLGIFIGLSAAHKPEEEIKMSFLDDPRKSFFSILILILIMVVSAAACFKYIERFVSVPYLQDAVSTASLDGAESSINEAVSLYPNDLYLRTYVQVYLSKINSLVAKGTLSESDKTDLKNSFDQATSAAQLAVNYDPTNFLNFESLGSMYATGASLGVPDAASQAITAYEKASSLNPLNPGLKLTLAQTAFNNKDIEGAKNYAQEALSLKGDYVNALVVLSQIDQSQGDNADALSYAQAALSLSPQDQNLVQYVNSLSNAKILSPATTTTDNKKQ